MKINITDFSSGFNVATATVILMAAITPAKAQADRGAIAPLPNNVVNGLFTPTQSQKFFHEGRAAFEREVEIFNNPERYTNKELLEFDPELIEQMKQLKLKKQVTSNEE